MRYSEDYIYGEPFDPEEFSLRTRQAGIRLSKTATQAAEAIRAFAAASRSPDA